MARVLLQHLLVAVDRGPRLFELGLQEIAQLEGDVDDLLAVGALEVLAAQGHQVAPALGAAVEPVEGPARALVIRLQLQHLLIGTDSPVRVLQQLLEEEADLHEQLQLLVAVEGLRDAVAVERLEVVPALVGGVQLLEREEGALVDRIVGEDLLVVGLGLRRLAQHDVVDLGDATGEVGGVRVAQLGLFEGGGERGGQVLVLVGLLGGGGQAVPQVGVARAIQERRFEGAVGSLDISQLGRRQLREAQAQLAHLLLVVARFEAHLEDVDELAALSPDPVGVFEEVPGGDAPALVLGGDAFEARDRGVVRRVELERVGVGLVAPPAVVELVGADLGEAQGQSDALRVDAHHVAAPAQDLRQLGPALGAEVQPVEGGEGGLVGGLDLEDGRVALGGRVGVGEGLLLQLGQLQQEHVPRAVVPRVVEAVQVEAPQVVHPLLGAVESDRERRWRPRRRDRRRGSA